MWVGEKKVWSKDKEQLQFTHLNNCWVLFMWALKGSFKFPSFFIDLAAAKLPLSL